MRSLGLAHWSVLLCSPERQSSRLALTISSALSLTMRAGQASEDWQA